MVQDEIEVGYQQRGTGENGLISSCDCIGDPSIVCKEANTFALNCYLFRRDSGTFFQTKIYQNTGTVAVPVWTKLSNEGLLTKKVSLTSAQILALYTTPIELIPTPGDGNVIQVIDVLTNITFKTAAYATNTELDIIDGTTGNVLFSDTGTVLAATANKAVVIKGDVSAAGIAVTVNGNVKATVATGDPITGAGNVDIYISYKVIQL